jgi:hypothetical protein
MLALQGICHKINLELEINMFKAIFAILFFLMSSQIALAQMSPPESSFYSQYGGNLLNIGVLVTLAGIGYLIYLLNKKSNIKPAISILAIGLIAMVISFAL